MTTLINHPDFLIDPGFNTVTGTDLTYSPIEKGIGGDFYKAAGDAYLNTLKGGTVIDQDSDFTLDAVVKLNHTKGTNQGFTLGGVDGTAWFTIQLTDPTTPDRVLAIITTFFDGTALSTQSTSLPTAVDITTDPVLRLRVEYRGSTGFPTTSISVRDAADTLIGHIDHNLSGKFSFSAFGVLDRPDLPQEATPFTNGFLTKLVLTDTVTESGLDITTELVVSETAMLLNRRSNILNISNRDPTIQRWIEVEKSLALRDIGVTESDMTTPTNFDATQIAQLQTQFREGLLSRVIARVLRFMNDSRAKFDEPNLKQNIMDHDVRANQMFEDISHEFHSLTSEDGESIPMMGLINFNTDGSLYPPFSRTDPPAGYPKRPTDNTQ